MAAMGSRRTAGRVAAAVLAGLVVAAAVLTYLSYTAAFTSTETVTVASKRAGLVMEPGAKVKFRGIQIGKVEDISYSGDQARLKLAIYSDDLHYVPSNATVHIAGNTIFGAKSVEFIPPQTAAATSLRPNSTVEASAVQLEVNTLFQSLINLLHKVDPVELNGTLSALSEGLRGHGDDLGALLSGLNTLTRQANPKLPTLQEDFRKAGIVTNIYGDAAPDLNTVFANLPTISKTVVDEQSNLNTTLLAAIGLANNGYETLAPAEQNLIDTINRLRAPLKVAADYSPEFGCLFAGIDRGIKEYAPLIGVRKAGADVPRPARVCPGRHQPVARAADPVRNPGHQRAEHSAAQPLPVHPTGNRPRSGHPDRRSAPARGDARPGAGSQPAGLRPAAAQQRPAAAG